MPTAWGMPSVLQWANNLSDREVVVAATEATATPITIFDFAMFRKSLIIREQQKHIGVISVYYRGAYPIKMAVFGPFFVRFPMFIALFCHPKCHTNSHSNGILGRFLYVFRCTISGRWLVVQSAFKYRLSGFSGIFRAVFGRFCEIAIFVPSIAHYGLKPRQIGGFGW